MEFSIAVSGDALDLDLVGEAVYAMDPAAVVDLHDGQLRVAGAFDTPTLVAALRGAGVAVAPAQVTRLPSACCGGCSG